MADKLFEPFLTHLEFLGYNISKDKDDDKEYLAEHSSYGRNILRPYLNGLLIQKYFITNKNAQKKRDDFLDSVNSLNNSALIVNYVIVGDKDMALRVDGLYLGEYSKAKFSAFIEFFNTDVYERFMKNDAIIEFME
ncbi:MAG: hypothetical protein ACE5HS_18365 [bacterium]